MIMKNRFFILTLMITLVVGTCICSASDSPTTMPLSIKMNASEPYDDEKFLEIVTPVINGLTDTHLNISERMDAESAYYSAASMKVSPEFYPVAVNVTSLLFYLVSSSEAYEEVEKDSGLGSHNEDVKESLKAQAKADEKVAEEAWHSLSMVYPNRTLFG